MLNHLSDLYQGRVNGSQGPNHGRPAWPILIRPSTLLDGAALERLAALDSRSLPDGSFLLAEVDGELVAAAPLEADADSLSDPFRPTHRIREFLELQVAGRPTKRPRIAVAGTQNHPNLRAAA